MSGALAAIIVLLAAAAASAQEAGATVAASVDGTVLNGEAEWSFAGAAGYRFNRTVGIEIEVTAVPALESASRPDYPVSRYTKADGRAVFFTNDMLIDLPMTKALTVYFVGGGGIAAVRHSNDVMFPYPEPLASTALAIPVRLPPIQRVSSSETDLALTLGGGLALHLSSHVSIEGDLRTFRLFGDTDTNVGRFGVGVRYRF